MPTRRRRSYPQVLRALTGLSSQFQLSILSVVFGSQSAMLRSSTYSVTVCPQRFSTKRLTRPQDDTAKKLIFESNAISNAVWVGGCTDYAYGSVLLQCNLSCRRKNGPSKKCMYVGASSSCAACGSMIIETPMEMRGAKGVSREIGSYPGGV